MDVRHFDHLTRAVATVSPRRGLLAVLASLPFLGGLLALLGLEEAAAGRNRRKKRQKPHKRAGRRRRKRKQRRKGKCRAHARGRTCADRCGTVTNNCGKDVDCGSCVCGGGCPICQTCNGRTGVCEPDGSQQGDACGAPGQVCQTDGRCACDAGSCAAGQHCQGAVCVCDDGSCAGCCDEAGACQPGTTDDACGAGGVACSPCTGVDTCQAGVCECIPVTCAAEGKDCGEINDGCGAILDCGTCPFPNQPCDDNVCGTCVPNCTGKPCGVDNDGCGGPCLNGSCPPNQTCGGGGTPGVCGCTPATCPAGTDCGTINDGCGGTVSCGGPCGGVCVNNVCTACSGQQPCPANHLCVAGACVACDVCASGCAFDSVQDAVDFNNGALEVVHICPGTYLGAKGRVTIARDVELIGAGAGEAAASNSILDAEQGGRVVGVTGGEVTLRHLRLTGGSVNTPGGGVLNAAMLTVDACVIVGNRASRGGGISNTGTLFVRDSTIQGNTAGVTAGGIRNAGVTTISGSTIQGNHTESVGGGGMVIENSPGAALTFEAPMSVVTGNTVPQGQQGSGIYRGGDGTLVGIQFVDVSGNTPELDQCFGCPAPPAP